uniref:Uncharacterized protein MANES_05G167800 n=1 Tax=Rhizophora mucronata TaxID=61149 RepID=A0A2P2L1B0_RHIMU
MGRSRAVTRSTGEDPNQRLKRKRLGPNVDHRDTATPSTVCQETIEGKRALYHCNYCHKDITGMIRIKCVVCPDFDLCIECFSVGAEVNPHKSNHPYRVMDNLAFPLICSDWNADEEMLLLEGIEMYGFGNWTEVAEHVGTKSKSQCIDHYVTVYVNSPCFPLPVRPVLCRLFIWTQVHLLCPICMTTKQFHYSTKIIFVAIYSSSFLLSWLTYSFTSHQNIQVLILVI